MHHKVQNVVIKDGILSLIVDGNALQCELQNLSPLLGNATEEKLQIFEVTPSGYGIYWPLLNEDISIDGLQGIVHKPCTKRLSQGLYAQPE